MHKIQSLNYRHIVVCILLITLNACTDVNSLTTLGTTNSNRLKVQGYISGDAPKAIQEASNIFRFSGNAVDAMVTAAFVTTVTTPARAGIGGGGICMIMNDTLDIPIIYDFLPYAQHSLNQQNTSNNIGVPAMLRGLLLMHRDHGNMDWRSLIAPAEKLARFGYRLSRFAYQDSQHYQTPPFIDRLYNGAKTGDIVKTPLLANTLSAIRHNPSSFYKGQLNEIIINDYKRHDKNFNNDILQQIVPKTYTPTVYGNDVVKTALLNANHHHEDMILLGTSLVTADLFGQAVSCFFTMGHPYGTGIAVDNAGFLISNAIKNQQSPQQIIQFHPFTKTIRAVTNVGNSKVSDNIINNIQKANITTDRFLENKYLSFPEMNNIVVNNISQNILPDKKNESSFIHLYCNPALSRKIEDQTKCQIHHYFNNAGLSKIVRN